MPIMMTTLATERLRLRFTTIRFGLICLIVDKVATLQVAIRQPLRLRCAASCDGQLK